MDHDKNRTAEGLGSHMGQRPSERLTPEGLAGPVTIAIESATTVNILCIISAPPGAPPQPATAGATKSGEGV